MIPYQPRIILVFNDLSMIYYISYLLTAIAKHHSNIFCCDIETLYNRITETEDPSMIVVMQPKKEPKSIYLQSCMSVYTDKLHLLYNDIQVPYQYSLWSQLFKLFFKTIDASEQPYLLHMLYDFIRHPNHLVDIPAYKYYWKKYKNLLDKSLTLANKEQFDEFKEMMIKEFSKDLKKKKNELLS